MGLEDVLHNPFCESLARTGRILRHSPKHLFSTLSLAATLGLPVACSGSGDKQPNPPTISGPGTTTPTTPQNIPPTILSNPVTQVNENAYYQYEIQAKSNSANLLNYSLVEGPAWLDVISNFISGKVPEVYENTTLPIKIRVSDIISSTEQSYNLNITNVSNSRALTLTQISQLSNVNSNSLVFSQPVSFVPRDIIGMGISSKTPEGLLREVILVSQDKKTVYTAQATLEQTINKTSFSFTKSLRPSTIQSAKLIEGASIAGANADFNFSMDLNNVVLYDRDGNLNTKTDQMVANGNISFNTDFTLNADIDNFTLKYFRFQNISSEKADISIGANLNGIAPFKEIEVGRYTFQPFVLGYILVPFPLPIPIPIVVTPKLGIYVNVSPTFVNPIAVRVTQEASLDTRLTYSGAWAGSASFANSFDFSNPIFTGEWDLKASTGPRLDLLLYGVAGPTAGANAGLKLNSQGGEYSLFGTLDANIGVSMNMLSKKVSADFEKVIEYEKLLMRKDIGTPTGNSFTDTRDGRTYKTVKIDNQTWMAENLNYNHANSKIYNNTNAYGVTYGRLYGRVGANESCPSGWKLPSSSDWSVLFNFLGGMNAFGTGGKMKSTGTAEAGTGLWHSPNSGATNQSGFAALPGGMAETATTTSFSDLGYKAHFWVSTPTGAQAYSLTYDTGYAGTGVAYGSNIQNIPLFSVRCLKN
jgi:uncharacterized protein (TIGR02145 family)